MDRSTWDGTVFVGSNDRRLYSLNPDGTLAWSFETEGLVRESALLDAAGNVYFGSDDSHFYALTSAGEEAWSYRTRGGFMSSPVLANGRIYVGSIDNRLYALNVAGGLPPENGWPMKRADASNSGRLR